MRELTTPIYMRPDATRERFAQGDTVWYLQTTPGGYGFQSFVPAVFSNYGPKRVGIFVSLTTGGAKLISVSPSNVRRREPSDPSAQRVV